jgi:hypothetical protein
MTEKEWYAGHLLEERFCWNGVKKCSQNPFYYSVKVPAFETLYDSIKVPAFARMTEKGFLIRIA